MKVLLVNGSSRKNGCTGVSLERAANALAEEGIDTEIYSPSIPSFSFISHPGAEEVCMVLARD